MIGTTTLQLNGLRLADSADGVIVYYTYPGSIDVHLGHGIKLTTTGKDAQDIRLGRLRIEPTATNVMDPDTWEWEEKTAGKARAWVQHVLAADALEDIQSYEFEGQVVIVAHEILTRTAEGALYAAGFRSSLATWRAAATAKQRARLPDLMRTVRGDAAVTEATYPKVPDGDLKEHAQHAWMRWHAVFGTDLDAGGRTYRVRGRPELRDDHLGVAFRHASSGSELTIRFDVASHPFLYNVTAAVDRQTLRREALAWHDFPALADDIGAAIKAQKKRPQAPSATPKAPAPASAYDDARRALNELTLPAKKSAYYMQRAKESIEDGKAWAPIVARARRTAEKLAGVHHPAKKGPPPTPRASSPAGPSAVDTAIDSFNSEPTWRAEKLRPRANGFVLVVYPEGKDVGAAVASVDIVHGEVDDLRWLDARLTHNDRDNIRERLERALWDADDGDDDDTTPRPSPLQDLIDLMERRSVTLGARATDTADLARDDGYRHIAEALRDLAAPAGSGVEELQRWLESEGMMSAGEMVGRARVADTASPRSLLSDIWSGVFEVLTLEQISGRPGTLVVPEEAIFRDNASAFVLQRVREGDRFVLHRIRVRVGEHDALTGTTTIEDRTDRLTRDANLHRADRTARFYDDLYSKLGAFHDDLERAPKALEDVRTLLYWSAVMLDAPLCQGEVKERAAVAFKQAKAYHDTARRQLLAGQTVDAARRIHEALRRISTGAAELARSCGDGQITLPGAAPVFGVMPSDEAVFTDEPTTTRGERD